MNAMERAASWLVNAVDEATQNEVRALMAENGSALQEAFYQDLEFGTGCLKVTPAHDVNDKTLGDKHNLEIIDIFNEDATLNSFGLHYEGKDRFVVRKEIETEFICEPTNNLPKFGNPKYGSTMIFPEYNACDFEKKLNKNKYFIRVYGI